LCEHSASIEIYVYDVLRVRNDYIIAYYICLPLISVYTLLSYRTFPVFFHETFDITCSDCTVRYFFTIDRVFTIEYFIHGTQP